MEGASADQLNTSLSLIDSDSLGAVSDIESEPGVGGCPYAKRMRMDDSYDSNFANDVDTNIETDPTVIAKLKEFQVLDEVHGDNDDEEGG